MAASPICVVSSSEMMTSTGWEDITNLTGHHSTPFQLYSDHGKTFIQVRSKDSLIGNILKTFFFVLPMRYIAIYFSHNSLEHFICSHYPALHFYLSIDEAEISFTSRSHGMAWS